MAERSAKDGFLEKMLGPVPGTKSSYAVRWVGDPVRQHLGLLLNTRRGSLPSLPDYGLPDISSFYTDYPASLAELRSLIQEVVVKYEPRLDNPRVQLMEQETKEFKASFLITGEVEDEHRERSRVQYKTTITSNGHASLGEPGTE
jgi:type VI secretion system protein